MQLGGNIMQKELNYQQALKMLEQGESVKCQLSSRDDENEIVHSKNRLIYLCNLSKEGVQLCKIYRIPHKKINIPENASEISFDEAYRKLYNGKKVYYQEEGKEEKISTSNELICIRRKFEMHGEDLVIYWHE
jgi:hypothetical protein